MTPPNIRDQIVELFSIGNLKDLCFDLGIDYEDLPGDTLSDKSRELIRDCYRKGKVEVLLVRCKELRPHREWYINEHQLSNTFKTPNKSLKSQRDFAYSKKQANITPSNPLVVGFVVDLSESMLDTLNTAKGQSSLSQQGFQQSVSTIIKKAVAFCRMPEAGDVLPLVKLFAYGYGFGQIRKRFNNWLRRIGVSMDESNIENIPSLPVRDLFEEAAKRYGIPITPNASELDINQELYEESVRAQFLDMGIGKPNLYNCLLTAFTRFNQELEISQKANAFLFLVSTGLLPDADDEQLAMLMQDINALGVNIISCYIGTRKICHPKKLYIDEMLNWPVEAKRLFHYSSVLNSESTISKELIDTATQRGWQVSDQSRLFIQLNNTLLFEELTEILLNSMMD